MKATGIIRRVDDLGRVVIPREIRINLGIREGSPLELYTEGNKIVLEKYKTFDSIKETLDSLEDLIDFYADEMKKDKVRNLKSLVLDLQMSLKGASK